MKRIKFYDIESLENVFTIGIYDNVDNIVDLYYILDDENIKINNNKVIEIIKMKNKNFEGTVNEPKNLNDDKYFKEFINIFKVDSRGYNLYKYDKNIFESVFNDSSLNMITDLENAKNYNLNNGDYYLAGYNSINYDNSMLALFFYEKIQLNGINKFSKFDKVTAKTMFNHNNRMFDEYKSNMRGYLRNVYENNEIYRATNNLITNIAASMTKSGMYLDVSLLNEKLSKVALKRLLGTLGFQILESEIIGGSNSKVNSEEELYDLCAYNISDIINLEKLFNHKHYNSTFNLKSNMLQTYSDLIYEKEEENNSSSKLRKVRDNRRTVNSTAAQISEMILSAGNQLYDIPAISYEYLGKNMLDFVDNYILNTFGENSSAYNTFHNNIYSFYKRIEGKNFNDGINYLEKYKNKEMYVDPSNVSDIYQGNTIFPYFDKNDKETSCYCNFSTGGSHGEEYNMNKFLKNQHKLELKRDDIKRIKDKYETLLDLKTEQDKLPKEERIDWKKYAKSGTTLKVMKEALANNDVELARSFYLDENDFMLTSWLNIKHIKDDMFTYSKNKEYSYTSSGLVINVDFSSYYPNMLRHLKAFNNPFVGKDIYGEIYDLKEEYGKLEKEAWKSGDKSKANEYHILRDGVKLILNAATGSADTKNDNLIQMNNMIYSMRILGQLMTFYVGQNLAYAGAKIISTNTDGLYITGLSVEETQKILDRCGNDIQILIEPEEKYLVSKDSNNRIEIDKDTLNIGKCSGGSLVGAKGPSVTSNATKPPIVDNILARYLRLCLVKDRTNPDIIECSKIDKDFKTKLENVNLENTMNTDVVKTLFNARIIEEQNKLVEFLNNKEEIDINEVAKSIANKLNNFSYVIASSAGSHTYPIGIDKDGALKILQKYNRIMFTKNNKNYLQMKSVALSKSAKEVDMIAFNAIKEYGYTVSELENLLTKENRKATFKKINGIDESLKVKILNEDLFIRSISENFDELRNLDIDAYVKFVEDIFNKNWKND